MVLRPNRKARAFASALSAPSALAIFAARKYGLIALSPITARSTDDADGAEAIISVSAHTDHSGPHPAFTRES
jgi:hypothetical protein